MSAARLLVPRLATSSSQNAAQQCSTSRNEISSFEFTSMEAGMMDVAGKSFGGSSSVRHALANFMNAANELQTFLPGGNEFIAS